MWLFLFVTVSPVDVAKNIAVKDSVNVSKSDLLSGSVSVETYEGFTVDDYEPDSYIFWARDYVDSFTISGVEGYAPSLNSVVYVVDGQVSYSPYLNVVDFVDFTGEGFVEDCEYSHGNDMAHIIGNSFTGYAPNVRIVNVKIFPCDTDEFKLSGFFVDAAEWLLETMNPKHVNVVNLSLSFYGPGQNVNYSKVKELSKIGKTYISVSAGNYSRNICAPFIEAGLVGLPNVFIVGGLKLYVDGVVGNHSDFGFGECVNVWLPSNMVVIENKNLYVEKHEKISSPFIKYSAGTSPAAAIMSGLLVLAEDGAPIIDRDNVSVFISEE